jgi:hypothetical protein
MSQSFAKIESFFREFPFLSKIVSMRRAISVSVSRIDQSDFEGNKKFYLFGKDGFFLAEKVKLAEVSSDVLADAHYAVTLQKPCNINPFIPAWLVTLVGLVADRGFLYYVTVYKPPKGLSLLEWRTKERNRIIDETRKEIADIDAE